MPEVDNAAFLRALFGADQRGVFTSSVEGDPNKARGYGYSAVLPAAHNNYFAVSRMKGRNRRASDFQELCCLVIDDVGPKVEPGLVLQRLGPPTYRLETSAGNEQWGYKLATPERDAARANGLILAACRVFGLSDMAGVNRLVRLPVGINGKPKANGFACRLVSFEPERALTFEALAEALGAVPEALPGQDERSHELRADDPIARALDALALRRGDPGQGGWLPILCPWHPEHTDRGETGTAYLPPSGFACHHSHCASKTFRDLREWLGVSAAEVEAHGIAAWAESLIASGKAPSAEQLSPPVETTAEALAADDLWTGDVDAEKPHAARLAEDAERLRQALRDAGVLLSTELIPSARTDYVVRGLLHEGEAAMLFGESGTLKTMVAVSLGLHLAAGLPWWGRKTRRGAALMVAAEGARGLRNRVSAQRRGMGLEDTADLPFAVLPRAVNLYARGPEADEAVKGLALSARRLERLYGAPLRLLVVDTLHQNTVGAEENSAKDFGRAYERVRELLAWFPTAVVLLVHHKGKDGADYRGSGAMRNDLDVLLDARMVGAPGPIAGRTFALAVDKAKDARDDQTLGYVGRVAVVGTDDEGEPIEAPFVADVSGAQLDALIGGAIARHWLVRLIGRMLDADQEQGTVELYGDGVPGIAYGRLLDAAAREPEGSALTTRRGLRMRVRKELDSVAEAISLVLDGDRIEAVIRRI